MRGYAYELPGNKSELPRTPANLGVEQRFPPGLMAGNGPGLGEGWARGRGRACGMGWDWEACPANARNDPATRFSWEGVGDPSQMGLRGVAGV